jgi:hypothetical protein
LDAQPSVASSRLPEGAAPEVSAPVQVRRAHIRTPTRHRAPDQEPGKDPDPRRRSSRGSGAQNRPACAAIAAMRRLRPVPSQRFLALWCQAHTPSCCRQVTSTSIRMVKPGPASAPRGYAPLRTDTLSLARTISDRIWHPLLAAAARPASAHIAHVLCALNRRRIRCRQSEGWLRHYARPRDRESGRAAVRSPPWQVTA